MLQLRKVFQGKCQQCPEESHEEIVEVCTCGAELCQRHALFHAMKNHERYPIRVAERAGVMITHLNILEAIKCKDILEVTKCKDILEATKCNTDISGTIKCNKGLSGADEFKKLLNLIKNKLLVSAIVQPKSRNKEPNPSFQACMHQMEVIEHLLTEKSEAKRKVFMGSAVCCICAGMQNRWLCLACGLVFCGGKKHDKKGEGHARRHFDQQLHSVFLDLDRIKSIQSEPEYDNNQVFDLFTFCSFCSEFVSSYLTKCILGIKYVLLSGCELCEGSGNRTGKEVEVEAEVEMGMQERCPGCTFDPEEDNRDITRCGITKKGNDSYFSTLLLAISFLIFNTAQERIEPTDPIPAMPGRGQKPIELNPITVDDTDVPRSNKSSSYLPPSTSTCAPGCFGCIFRWTMYLMFAIHSGEKKVFDINPIWEILYGQFGIYKDNEQQDIFRLFRHLMSQFKIYDASQHFDSISNLFHFCLRSKIQCEKCHERWDKTEKCFIVYLKPRQSIREYFSIKQLDSFCKCGAERKTVQSVMSSIPEILTFKTKKMEKSILGDTGELKIEREIDVPYALFREKEGVLSHGFTNYSLRAAVIHQESPSGGQYFVQFLDGTETLGDKTEGKNLQIPISKLGKYVNDSDEKHLWRSISDDKTFFSTLFETEAIMLFYLRVYTQCNDQK